MSRQSLNAAFYRKSFIIPDGIDIADIKTVFCEKFHCAESPVHSLQRTFHDSFDWRIFDAGAAMEAESRAGGSTLNWRDLKSDAILGSASIEQAIRFSWNLPPGGLRERIEPLLEMRALLPLVRTRCKVHGLNVLNKDKKTVVRLAIEETRLAPTHKSRHNRLSSTLYVEPVKGYSEPFQQVLSVIEQQFALEPDKQGLALRVFAAAGLQPGGYSSRLNLQLTPDMRSDAAARAIMLRLLETMQANEPGLKTELDSEFLHDYRVAVRRSRSMLGQVKGVLPRAKQERFRREFSWLGEITSPTRDMDVYLLDFHAFKNSLPAPLKEAIVPFHDFLEKHQKIEHRRLVKQLASARYRKLIADWHACLTSPLPRHSSLPNALRPAIDVANERIWRMFRRVISEGESIQPDSPPEDLHELRKSCKKLRYLIEFFLSLYPRNHVKQSIYALKSLQDQLGEYQDLHVQLASMATIRAQMIAEGVASERMLVAFDLIMQTMDRRQEKVRKIFRTRFTAFADRKNRENFAKLFKPKL